MQSARLPLRVFTPVSRGLTLTISYSKREYSYDASNKPGYDDCFGWHVDLPF
jgi:hypothetical protein